MCGLKCNVMYYYFLLCYFMKILRNRDIISYLFKITNNSMKIKVRNDTSLV